MAYPYYPNNQYYMQNMQNMQDLQSMKDRIDRQMQQIQQQNQVQQQPVPNVTQNFQIAPNVSNEIEGKYANSIEDVRNTFVMKVGVFVNRDFSTLWIKNVNGDIRTFNTEEVLEMDEKDKEIMMLRKEIENMKGMINYESDGNSSNNDESNESKNAKKLPSRTKPNAK